jgi:polyhydroxyalkanoate synthesis repressor PhaR
MQKEIRLIKKYPNRRLYDTSTSSYITQDDVRRLLLEGVAVKVEDARERTDLTRTVLLQIIMDLEMSSQALLSQSDLLALLGRYTASLGQDIGALLYPPPLQPA